MRITALLFAGLFVADLSKGQGTWVLDKSHSSLNFTIQHLVITEVEGSFKVFDGTLESVKPDFSDAKINFTADVSSISTDNDSRDSHLKADDFFNAEKFPQIIFRSTSFKKITDNKYELTGNLTIRDITKTVKFDVNYGGTVKDPWGNTKAGFKATGTINRFDYGLKWNTMTEAGGAVAGEDVKMVINVEFTRK